LSRIAKIAEDGTVAAHRIHQNKRALLVRSTGRIGDQDIADGRYPGGLGGTAREQ